MADFVRKIILILLAIAWLPACTPLFIRDLTGEKGNRTVVLSKTEDEIYGTGRIQNEEILTQFPSAIALVGKKQTYILLQGTEQLQKISRNLDGRLIELSDHQGRQHKPGFPMDISINGNEFFGESWLIYRKKRSDLTAQEHALLSSMGGSRIDARTGFFVFPIRVSGFVPQSPVQIRGDKSDFKVKRTINLVVTEKREVWVRYPNPFALFMLPIAVVLDVVITAPYLLVSGAVQSSKDQAQEPSGANQ